MIYLNRFKIVPESKDKRFLYLILLMLVTILFTLLTLFGFISLNKNNYHVDYYPEQIHLAIGEDNSQMVVIWSTKSDPEESTVRYGFNCSHTRPVKGLRRVLDSEGEIQYIHLVTLKYLLPQTSYCYSVGSRMKWSKPYSFVTFPKHHEWSPTVALFGDMGVENGRSIPSLVNNTSEGNFDAVIHVGDIAYNLYALNGRIGDAFMRAIEPFAARVPYMVVPGNHEYVCYANRCPGDSGASYETRFQMPGSSDSSYYTFTLGPALFVGINTEVYFESEILNLEASQRQKAWLEQVLTQANKPENRARHPWIIVFGHRPLYCTSFSECIDGMTFVVKEGHEVVGSLFDIDDILYKYGVDLAFWGHQHYYERTFPVYNQTAFVNSMYENAFVNPRATVHIVSGAAGMHSGNDMLAEMPALWTAFRSNAYGYTRFTIFNETHLYIEQIDVDQNDKVIDAIWVIQSKHIPFPEKNKNIVF